ncbi:PREDICTED: alpha-tubulin N-acetyltransferase-like [Ceratosolen solmsi marchali]|uniref:Alpha-tubulin N-acetyltransferase n=1 Tax=Ceratosolen solmsi marchali TaxID=326594 RepID=A0AAJ6YNX8_9HYME|nr:PREDICTED: alpha-tubulin N-acetyltransferase-like [Ceratosolen solmsi marchali]
MDFRFDINSILPNKINKITHTLIPENFKGNRREYNDCQRLLTTILDEMGEASAKAQGLNRTITSAVKLRDTDHIIYLMVEDKGNNGLGSIVGLLKTGSKSLFMFDENGLHYQLKPRCILDFYIHESRQRMGLGNELYQYMLSDENLKPIKLAIDRPSDKFLAFLKKHYGLTSIIPQNNKFVVFKGFFDDEFEDPKKAGKYTCLASLNKQSTEYNIHSNNFVDVHSSKPSINGTPITRSAYGRYAASRPPCSMANIIHNTAANEQSTEPMRYNKMYRPSATEIKMELFERPDSLNLYAKEDEKQIVDNDIRGINSGSIVNEQMAPIEQLSLKDFQNTTSQVIDKPDLLHDEISGNTISNDKYLQSEITNQNKSASPSCSQEIIENQQPSTGHLDLKFYHSPLW